MRLARLRRPTQVPMTTLAPGSSPAPRAGRQRFRQVLAVRIERDHAGEAVAARVADAGLGRAPGAEPEREAQACAPAACAIAAVRSAELASSIDQHRASRVLARAAPTTCGHGGCLVASGDHRQAIAGAQGAVSDWATNGRGEGERDSADWRVAGQCVQRISAVSGLRRGVRRCRSRARERQPRQ